MPEILATVHNKDRIKTQVSTREGERTARGHGLLVRVRRPLAQRHSYADGLGSYGNHEKVDTHQTLNGLSYRSLVGGGQPARLIATRIGGNGRNH